MCYFGKENFNIFLFHQYSVKVDEEQVKEEAELLYKKEVNKNVISKKLLAVATELIFFETYTCVINKNEWIVCVASDADTSYPLFLYCLKDGIKVYEEILKEE
ncbi:hypothetical protein [Carnobacterium jeotgali]|uniref:hypothetical protein n=1 Tax=Carnobacterium jeotgali TaxID=545534 RepID=UPI0004931233|nr:hypothetical protein [Carnobacterium jeotgali]